MSAKVAFVTCAELPNLEAGEALIIPLLAERGIDAEAVVWDDPDIDWYAYDLVIIRSTRDYAERRGFFIAWAKSLPHLANPASVIEWNTDKHYLIDLEERGVPVVHTNWLEPGDSLTMMRLHTRFPAMGDFVIKPAISAGSVDTARYSANTSYERGMAIRHALRMLQDGRSVMLQRYIRSVDTEGEHSLVFFNGEYLYAMYKGPMLEESVRGDVNAMYRQENMIAYTASFAEREVARKALEAAIDVIPCLSQSDLPLLYARVDLVKGDDGEPVLMELELTDPSLCPDLVSGASLLVADAIAKRIHAGQAV